MLRTVSRLDSEAPSEAISRGVADGCTTEQRLTRSLLGYGIVAGPFYVVVSLAQAAPRDGFELSRHHEPAGERPLGMGGWARESETDASEKGLGEARPGRRGGLAAAGDPGPVPSRRRPGMSGRSSGGR